MTFLLDHDVPIEVQRLLRRAGESGLQGNICFA